MDRTRSVPLRTDIDPLAPFGKRRGTRRRIGQASVSTDLVPIVAPKRTLTRWGVGGRAFGVSIRGDRVGACPLIIDRFVEPRKEKVENVLDGTSEKVDNGRE